MSGIFLSHLRSPLVQAMQGWALRNGDGNAAFLYLLLALRRLCDGCTFHVKEVVFHPTRTTIMLQNAIHITREVGDESAAHDPPVAG